MAEDPTEWSYVKLVVISGSPGAGTGYQVLLKVGESSGASDCDFHVEGHSAKFPSGTNDSGDLRFVDNDGSTFLNFWVEKVEGTAPNRVAYCWVKINDNLDSDVNIYCYYGNANASNVSNGEETFIYFNDSGDTAGWTISGVGTLSTSNGRLRVDSDNGGFSCYRGNVQNASITATVFPQHNERYSLSLRRVSGNTRYTFGGDIGTTWLISKTVNGSHTALARTSSGPTVNATHKLEFRISGTSLEGLVDDSVLLTVSDSSITDSGAFGLRCWYYSINEFDNIYVRKYISPEPSFFSAGSEEEITPTALEDAMLDLRTLGPAREDFPLDLKALGLAREDFSLHFIASEYRLINLKSFLKAVSGEVLSDLSAFLSASDGTVTRDCRMFLICVEPVPEFRHMVFQRLSPVIKEV